MTDTEALLFDRYRTPLLPLTAVAEILDRSPNGLRVSLSSSPCESSKQLLAAKVKVGRRIYFRISEIARLIDES